MSEKVFAYGSNMCSGRFRDYGVVPEEVGRPALLQDFRLCFNKVSQEDQSGKANVKAHRGRKVWGVLYTIPDAHLTILDDGEGGYLRKKMPVRTTDGTATKAWVYVARQPSRDPTLRPYTWYKRFLVEGARQHGLPDRYVQTLERIKAKQDKNKQRDAEKRALQYE